MPLRLLFILLLLPIWSWAEQDNKALERPSWGTLFNWQVIQRQSWRSEVERPGDMSPSNQVHRARLESNLNDGAIVSTKPIASEGLENAYLVKLSNGVTAVFKTQKLGGNIAPKVELATFLTNQALGFPIRIPVTVWRIHNGSPGTLQLWVDEQQRFKPKERMKRIQAWRHGNLSGDIFFFDFLVDNFDRNIANLLLDREFGVIATDAGAAFSERRDQLWSRFAYLHGCEQQNIEDQLVCLEQVFSAAALKTKFAWPESIHRLNRERLRAQLTGWIDAEQIDKLERRICVLKSFFDHQDMNGCFPRP